MAAKFRGNSDDWLDSPDSRDSGGRKRAARAKKHERSDSLPFDQANATVAEVFPNQCRVRLDEPAGSSAEILCSYRRGELLGRSQGKRERSPVAVGDRVRVEVSNPQSGVVTGACERRNRLVRKAPGRDTLLHVVAANVDVVAVVASASRPEFSPGLADRFLVVAASQGLTALIIVTKMDLVGEASASRSWQLYSDLGFEVLEVAAKTGWGVRELGERLAQKTVVFCGHSGVGKTSLLSALTGREVGRIGDVNKATGKGQHTTTSAVLVSGPDGGPAGARWIDTPGIREFSLVGIRPDQLAGLYPDLAAARCATAGCLHDGEPGCAAVGLPRHASYLRVLESLRPDRDAGQ